MGHNVQNPAIHYLHGCTRHMSFATSALTPFQLHYWSNPFGFHFLFHLTLNSFVSVSITIEFVNFLAKGKSLCLGQL